MLALVLAGGVGACATYWPTFSGASTSSVPDAFQCAMTGTADLGFKPTVWNKRTAVLEARRANDSIPSRLPDESRVTDVLEVQVKPAKGSAASALSVRAKTVVARFTRAGWKEDGVPASDLVQTAARTLLQRCSEKREAGFRRQDSGTRVGLSARPAHSGGRLPRKALAD